MKNIIEIKLPQEATKYLLFQRTPYLLYRRNRLVQKINSLLPKRLAYALESLFSNYNFTVSLEAQLTRKKVQNLFNIDMDNEYNEIKKYLPQKAESILDIGCGIPGIDVLLNHHYQNLQPKIFLLDKTEMPKKVYYSLTNRGCFYNSLPVAKKFLEINTVSKEKIFTQEATDNNEINFSGPFDLVISLISWGFHYPVPTYLDTVYSKLSQGGKLIIDVRKTPLSNPLQEIRNKFKEVTIIKESNKHWRLVATK